MKEQTILKTLPLIKHIAWQMTESRPYQKVEVSDLVQDGVLGLIDALSRFDKSRGIKLETFVDKRIRGAMMDGLRKGAWPRLMRKRRRELFEAEESLRTELKRVPSYAELSVRLGWNERNVRRSIWRISVIESMAGLSDKLAMLPAGFVPAEPESPEKTFEIREIQKRVRKAMTTLLFRERQVIFLCYFKGMTLKEISKIFGISRTRVSQLHAKAIRNIRMALET
ncbi:MAG: sigma-70 family RNA polymerase sigma factor [Patescibacteria group bacterium]